MTVEELINGDSLIVVDGEYTNGAIRQAYTEGYNEAMRWRAPKDELPDNGQFVQMKIFNGHTGRLEYMHDEYLGKNEWGWCSSKYIEIMGWRPIN